MEPQPWPLRGLVLRTPRLELRPDDDEGLAELAALAGRGVHPPETMPFLVPWTDRPAGELELGALQHHWLMRAGLGPADWTVCFLVRRGGRVVGEQTVRGRDFRVTREVATGSWLGREHQGQGLGTEMRAAVLLWAFDCLGAARARSGAFADNTASLAVSRRLGYADDGTATHSVRGAPVLERRMVLTAAAFAPRRPEWELAAEGWRECLPLLGAD